MHLCPHHVGLHHSFGLHPSFRGSRDVESHWTGDRGDRRVRGRSVLRGFAEP